MVTPRQFDINGKPQGAESSPVDKATIATLLRFNPSKYGAAVFLVFHELKALRTVAKDLMF